MIIGILQRATDAKTNTDNAQIKERVQLAYLAGLSGGKGSIDKASLLKELQNEFGADKVTEDNIVESADGKTWTVTIDGATVELAAGSTTVAGGGENDGIDIKTLQTDTTKPYLPSNSFSVSTEPSEQTVNGGLVITDGENEFVWIEVPMTETVYPNAKLNITTFTDAECFTIASDLATYANSGHKNKSTLAEHLPTADRVGIDYTSAYKDILKSIYQNGGFYIGRYETGIKGTEENTANSRTSSSNTDQIAIIKANVHPYTYVTLEQAQTLSQGISSGTKSSSLLMGVQWDLVLKFLKEKGIEETELYSDSSSWGNYSNAEFTFNRGMYNPFDADEWELTEWKSYATDTPNYVVSNKKIKNANDGDTAQGMILTTTGASNQNNKKNIYDLAGNVYEWTIERVYVIDGEDEYYSDYSYRGGVFYNQGIYYPASCSDGGMNGYGNYRYGFRVCIY